MVQIALIRPGTTDYDLQGRIQGRLDIPLNQQGLEQIAGAIECLRGSSLVALYSSMCRAAQETAELLGRELGLKPKALERLQNLDHGLWQGMQIDEVKRKQPTVYRQWQEHPEIICPPNGEMLSAVEERTAFALEKLLRKHRFGTIGLVAPEPLASVIRSRLQGTEVRDLWKAVNGCGRVEILEVSTLPRSRSNASTSAGSAVVPKIVNGQ